MKRGIILTRKHGGKELEALGPALPYHEQVARFKKDFQSIAGGTHEKFEEVLLVPVEGAASKRVRFVTAKRAKEIGDAHTKAIESASKAAAKSDEIKKLMADATAARAKVEHFERALESAKHNQDPETKAKAVAEITSRIERAKSELKQAEKALSEAEAKAEAEQTPTKSEK